MLGEWVRERTEKLPFTPSRASSLSHLKSRWVLACLAVVGIIFLMWPVSGKPDSGVKETAPAVEQADGESPEAALERELAGILSQVDGAGRVEVSLTLASDGVKSYAFNNKEESRAVEETDKAGGVRKTTETNLAQDVVVSASQSPLLIEKKAPLVKGVLVVADGAFDPVIKEQITDAVVTLLDIPASKVRVLPRGQASNFAI